MNIVVAKYILRWLKYFIVIPVVLFAIGLLSLPSGEMFWIREWDYLVTEKAASNIMGIQVISTIIISGFISFFLKLNDQRQMFKVFSLVWMLYSMFFGLLFSLVSTDYIFSWACIFLIAPYIHLLVNLTDKADKVIKSQEAHIDI